MAPLIMAGLTLLPKIPELWNGIAGLFGAKVPDSVEKAGDLASTVIKQITGGNVSDETKVKLQELMNSHEVRIKELALAEKQLDYDNMANQVDLEKEAYKSDDEYVRRTRPKILRQLFYLCAAYALLVPYCLFMTVSLGGHTLPEPVMESVIWIGGWLFGTFSTSYLGYSAARSIDKKNPDFKNQVGMINTVVKKIL